MAVAVVGVLFAGGYSPAPAGDETVKGKNVLTARWEYQVLTKEQVADLGKNNLAAGLNKLGEESWELVAVEASSPPENLPGRPAGKTTPVTYYFKRQATTRAEAPPPAVGDFKSFALKSANSVQAIKVIQELLGTDGKRVRLVADERTNQILVQAPPDDLARIEKILFLLDGPGGK
jgi:hypothetical protein